MDIVLYYAPVACSLVPYVTLTEAKANFTVRRLNLRKGQQNSADYLQVNPKHKVPLLMVDGKPLTENVAIQLWIARNFPAAQLMPSDPWQEAQAVSILAWCASGMHPLLGRIFSPGKVCDVPGSEDSVRKLAQEQLFEFMTSPTACSRDATTSSTTSPRLTRTSSGASGAPSISSSTFPSSAIASSISNA